MQSPQNICCSTVTLQQQKYCCCNNTSVMGIHVMLLKLQSNKCTSVLLQSLHSDGHNYLLYGGTSAKKKQPSICEAFPFKCSCK